MLCWLLLELRRPWGDMYLHGGVDDGNGDSGGDRGKTVVMMLVVVTVLSYVYIAGVVEKDSIECVTHPCGCACPPC